MMPLCLCSQPWPSPVSRLGSNGEQYYMDSLWDFARKPRKDDQGILKLQRPAWLLVISTNSRQALYQVMSVQSLGRLLCRSLSSSSDRNPKHLQQPHDHFIENLLPWLYLGCSTPLLQVLTALIYPVSTFSGLDPPRVPGTNELVIEMNWSWRRQRIKEIAVLH